MEGKERAYRTLHLLFRSEYYSRRLIQISAQPSMPVYLLLDVLKRELIIEPRGKHAVRKDEVRDPPGERNSDRIGRMLPQAVHEPHIRLGAMLSQPICQFGTVGVRGSSRA